MATEKEKKKIFDDALKIIKEKDLIFIEEVVSYVPISKETFYNYYPLDSDRLDSIKDALNINKLATKELLRKKWRQSENPTLQIALYRLTSDKEEHKLLNQTYVDQTSGGEKITNDINLKIIDGNGDKSTKTV